MNNDSLRQIVQQSATIIGGAVTKGSGCDCEYGYSIRRSDNVVFQVSYNRNRVGGPGIEVFDERDTESYRTWAPATDSPESLAELILSK